MYKWMMILISDFGSCADMKICVQLCIRRETDMETNRKITDLINQ